MLLSLLNGATLFSQNSYHTWCLKAYYGKQYDQNLDLNYPCVGLEGNYHFTPWVNAGVFVNGGKYNYHMSDGEFSGYVRDLFWKYGIDCEFHPIPLVFPNFKTVDIYLDGYLGAFTFTSGYWPTRYKFLYGVGIGAVVNLSRHFGLFYERDYDNVNVAFQDNREIVKAMNRFGINIRF
ncbi:MAG: hypothetical protein IKM85_01745 [Bacteroidales bacterium]|nr:hypothetical protein [Bacteroidales bacterium]